MTDAINPCPNPECRAPCVVLHSAKNLKRAYCTEDLICGYHGPAGATEAEAIRLHNLIGTPPAGWKLVPVELLNWWHEKADDIDDDCKTILPAFKGAESEGSILGIQAVAQQLRHSIAGIAAPENDDER